MKINPLSTYGMYGSSGRVAKKNLSRSVETAPEAAGKGDTIRISREAAGQKELGRIAGSVLQELRQSADAARLNEIRDAIAENTYSVSSDQVADAILSRAFGL